MVTICAGSPGRGKLLRIAVLGTGDRADGAVCSANKAKQDKLYRRLRFLG